MCTPRPERPVPLSCRLTYVNVACEQPKNDRVVSLYLLMYRKQGRARSGQDQPTSQSFWLHGRRRGRKGEQHLQRTLVRPLQAYILDSLRSFRTVLRQNYSRLFQKTVEGLRLSAAAALN